MTVHLGEFEQLVLLAIVRLGGEASGAAIREAVEDGSQRTVWIGAVYTTLQRLTDKGLIAAEVLVPEAPGRRKRKIFALTAEGQTSIARAYDTWARMTRGLKPKLETL